MLRLNASRLDDDDDAWSQVLAHILVGLNSCWPCSWPYRIFFAFGTTMLAELENWS